MRRTADTQRHDKPLDSRSAPSLSHGGIAFIVQNDRSLFPPLLHLESGTQRHKRIEIRISILFRSCNFPSPFITCCFVYFKSAAKPPLATGWFPFVGQTTHGGFDRGCPTYETAGTKSGKKRLQSRYSLRLYLHLFMFTRAPHCTLRGGEKRN